MTIREAMMINAAKHAVEAERKSSNTFLVVEWIDEFIKDAKLDPDKEISININTEVKMHGN